MEMIGYSWGYWLVAVGMVLASFVVGLGIAAGAVALLMETGEAAKGKAGE